MPKFPLLASRLSIAQALVWLAAAATGQESPESVGAAEARAGERLASSLGCLACHRAEGNVAARLAPRPAADLAEVGARLSPEAIAGVLAEPSAWLPIGGMPRLVAGLPAPQRAAAAEALAHYLVSLGGPIANDPTGVGAESAERGRVLYHRAGCVACHAPFDDGPRPAGAVRQPQLSKKTTIPALAAFLRDPLRARPSGRMPSLSLTEDEARDVASYLLREQRLPPGPDGAAPLAWAPGLEMAVFRGRFERLPEFGKLEAASRGVVPALELPHERPGDEFALLYRGALRVPREGDYTLVLVSDDGSRLLLDGKVVIDLDGIHPPEAKKATLRLAAGDHPLEAQYFERDGGEELALEIEGADGSREPVPASWFAHGSPAHRLASAPFAVDAAKASEGKRLFGELGCAACHSVPGAPPPPAAKPWGALDPASPGGCLVADPAPRIPNYSLDEADREALAGLLRDRGRLAQPLAAGERATRALQELRCVNCHERAGAGGPALDRSAWFKTVGQAELGEEGRVPPPLTGVGAKLREDWLQKVLLDRGRVRPYMATRMPQFGARALGALARDLAEADGAAAEPEPPFSAELVAAGRALVSTGSFSCITCHVFAGNDSLGIPALDIATSAQRLRYGWFRRYLMAPDAYRPGTRMPEYFREGVSSDEDVLGGSPERQTEALWAYLSLGASAPLPEGLKPKNSLELAPTDGPIVFRTFFEGVGPLGVAVGFPERVHCVFDAGACRLAKVWRGRFLDASAAWAARAGQFAAPLGEAASLPAGFVLDVAGDTPLAAERPRWRGYRLDAKGIPTFLYSWGPIEVSETLRAELRPGGAVLRRMIEARAPRDVPGLLLRAAAGDPLPFPLARRADGAFGQSLELEIAP